MGYKIESNNLENAKYSYGLLKLYKAAPKIFFRWFPYITLVNIYLVTNFFVFRFREFDKTDPVL